MLCASLQILVAYVGLTLVAAEKSPFSGTWEGKMNGLPGVDVTIEGSSGEISGEIVFYFQMRGDEKEKWRVQDKSAVRIIRPRVLGKIFTFEAIHHKTHGSSERGPNAKFRMEITGEDEAMLYRVDPDPGPPLKLTRRRR